jgi:hypothetical protein
MGAVMARWKSSATQPGSGGVGEKTKLTAGAHLIERREGGGQLGRHEPKWKTYFRKYATDARASWASKNGFGPRAGPAGPKADWACMVSRAESEEEEFLN